MLNRYKANFAKVIWNSLPQRIKRQSEQSIWYKFLSVIFSFISVDVVTLINYVYSQIFSESMDSQTLELKARDLRVVRKIGESNTDFFKRYQIEKLLRSSELSKKLLKKVFMIFLGVDAEIIESTDYEEDIFTIGVTPLGTGRCFESGFFRFTWEAILPDLSQLVFDKKTIIELLDEFSPNCEYFIYEKRGQTLYQWEVQ